jgi:streptomycin 6-kinase
VICWSIDMDLLENMNVIYGDKGRKWLANLPLLVENLATKWNLRDLIPCDDLSYNYVMSGWSEDLPIILKIGIDLFAIQQEFFAIQAFNGHGLIELLAADLDQGAILITRAVPGKTLISLFPDRDNEALGIACRLAKSLHKAIIPTDHKFPHLSEWFSIIDKDWDLPKDKLQLARNLRTELFNKSTTNVILHGDLHYANILSDGNGWIVIDPKGVIGDPLYDMTGALLREPFQPMMQLPDIAAMLQQRMKFAAQYCKVDVQKIWAWTFVQTVMSICWSLEDGQDVALKRKFLDILSALQF